MPWASNTPMGRALRQTTTASDLRARVPKLLRLPYAVHERLSSMEHRLKDMGVMMPAPFMTLSFLALSVIPELKITDLGLVDVTRFELVPLGVD